MGGRSHPVQVLDMEVCGGGVRGGGGEKRFRFCVAGSAGGARQDWLFFLSQSRSVKLREITSSKPNFQACSSCLPFQRLAFQTRTVRSTSLVNTAGRPDKARTLILSVT